MPPAIVSAQDIDGDEKPKAAAEAKDKTPPSKEADADRKIAEISRDPNEDTLVRTLLASQPATATELVRAIKILVDVKRPEVAKLLVKRLLETKPTPRDMDQLIEQFSTAAFIQLSTVPELAPDMAKFVDSVLTGAAAYREDPQRLDNMIGALRSNNVRTRQEAVVQLARAHGAAVMPLLNVLADPKRADEHAAVRTMLVQLASDAVGPLRGTLETGDTDLKVQVIEVLGRIGDRKPLLMLLRPAVDPQADPALRAAARKAVLSITGEEVALSDAQTGLEREAARLLRYAVAHGGELVPTTEIWRWDSTKGQSVAQNLPAAVAAADEAAALASDLEALRPNHAPTRQLWLTALLTAAKLDQDLDAALPTGTGSAHDVAVEQGMDASDDVLAGALESGNDMAAAAAADILGEIGKPALLTRFGQRPAPLALAAQSGNRRVRFAALNAMLKLASQTRFPGASAITDDLRFFAGTSGTPRVLIGHPRSEQAQALAGLLAGLGYDVDIATNGRQTLALATESPDYDFVLLHFNLAGPQIDEMLTALRRDPCTRQLPIGIMVSLPENLKPAERLAAGAPLTTAFAVPGTPKILKYKVEELLGLLGRHNVPFDERQREAAAAVDWIASLAVKTRHSVYDLRPLVPAVERAFSVPTLQEAAATALANLGTVSGQRALLEAADRGTQPLAARQAAAAAFRRSVELHGILLTKGEILQQYALYNNSEKSEPAVQEVFGSLLDTLERRGEAADNGASR
jgi:CheY-like chemotaxis protein